MSQLLFTHKNYDPFHSYIRLIKYLFKIMLFFKQELTFLTFSLKICNVLITHYRVVAVVLFSRDFVVQEHCNKNVLTFRSFVFLVNFRASIDRKNKSLSIANLTFT